MKKDDVRTDGQLKSSNESMIGGTNGSMADTTVSDFSRGFSLPVPGTSNEKDAFAYTPFDADFAPEDGSRPAGWKR